MAVVVFLCVAFSLRQRGFSTSVSFAHAKFVWVPLFQRGFWNSPFRTPGANGSTQTMINSVEKTSWPHNLTPGLTSKLTAATGRLRPALPSPHLGRPQPGGGPHALPPLVLCLLRRTSSGGRFRCQSGSGNRHRIHPRFPGESDSPVVRVCVCVWVWICFGVMGDVLVSFVVDFFHQRCGFIDSMTIQFVFTEPCLFRLFLSFVWNVLSEIFDQVHLTCLLHFRMQITVVVFSQFFCRQLFCCVCSRRPPVQAWLFRGVYFGHSVSQ